MNCINFIFFSTIVIIFLYLRLKKREVNARYQNNNSLIIKYSEKNRKDASLSKQKFVYIMYTRHVSFIKYICYFACSCIYIMTYVVCLQ